MNTPGFTASNSLYVSDVSYLTVGAFSQAGGSLQAAQIDPEPDPEGSYSCMHPDCGPCTPRRCFPVPRFGTICIPAFQVCHCISHRGVLRTFTRPC